MSLLNELDNALFCDPQGNYTATKIMSTSFQFLLLNSFFRHDDVILASWDILALFIAAFIAPDILKKVITMKFGAGVADGETRTTTSTASSNSTTTQTAGTSQ